MTTVELRFPACRYHGTAWGRHVNEGVPEWPPSPYRLMRGLYDAWRRKCADIPEDHVRSVLSALSGDLPVYHLPKAVAAHTRSYLSSNTEDPTDKSLIFDGFVALAPGAVCYIEWPVELTPEQRETLRQLLGALNYLGRSESWIDAGLARASLNGPANCSPVTSQDVSGELIPIACPVAPLEYSGKRPWFDALTYSTSEMLKQKRSIPPAMRSVPYVRPVQAVATWLSPRRRAGKAQISAVLLSLSGRVLPVATETIRVAEKIRAALISKIGFDPRGVFHGKTADGTPLTGHRHVFILPEANGQGRIDKARLYLQSGALEESELDAIRRLRVLRQFEDHPIGVVLTWAGNHNDSSFRKEAASVRSLTPFVTTRHWRKGRGTVVEFLKEEVRRECRNHDLPDPIRVELLDRLDGPFRLPQFFRRNRAQDPSESGYAFRIEFPTTVRVPFSLGYGCHFGMGQFGAP